MKLKPITAQKTDLRRFYKDWQESTPNSETWREFGAMMLALIEYLEKEVEAPSQWTHTSHGELVLSDEDTYTKGRVWINAYPKKAFETLMYEIRYSVDNRWAMVGYTDEVKVAAEMILEALERADKRED